MSRRRGTLALGLVLVGLGALLARLSPSSEQRADRPLPVLGPLAHLAAEGTWIAAQGARSAGQLERAVVLAERAVSLVPGDADGWERYGALLGGALASPEGEPDPALRLAWVQAALTVYSRGEAACDEPGPLALARAVLLLSRVEADPELPWPGGRRALLLAAADALDDASRWDPSLAELAASVRRDAER